MTLPTGAPGGPRRDGLAHALDAVRRLARDQADELLASVPDTGDAATGRAVDDFVEQASDALRALDEAVSRTVRTLEGLPAADPSEPADEPRPGAYRSLPEAWR